MTDAMQRVATTCPACSPSAQTVHVVLSPGGQATVRCSECDHVHKTALPEAREVERDVVVSQDGESFTARTEAPPDEQVAVGEEFVLETEEGIFTVRITSLEVGQGRADEALVEDVDTFWTRAVGNVSVDVTVHPRSGAGGESYATTVYVPGDHEFTVGETETFGDEEFTVQSVMVRDDAVGYDFEKLDHGGDAAIAKDIKRLYGRDETTEAWSAW